MNTELRMEQLDFMGFTASQAEAVSASIDKLLALLNISPAFLPDTDSISCMNLLSGNGENLKWELDGFDEETQVYRLLQNGEYRGIKLFILTPVEDREFSYMFYTEVVANALA